MKLTLTLTREELDHIETVLAIYSIDHNLSENDSKLNREIQEKINAAVGACVCLKCNTCYIHVDVQAVTVNVGVDKQKKIGYGSVA